jgi:hypothetical protein
MPLARRLAEGRNASNVLPPLSSGKYWSIPPVAIDATIDVCH